MQGTSGAHTDAALLPDAGDGEVLHVEAIGDGAPILLIHGTAPALWGPLPGRLAELGRVISYDRRSFMASEAPPLSNLGRHTDDARLLLERLSATPAVVVGWSIGAVIALDLALRYPESVAALVLLEPPFRAKRHPTLAMVRGILGAKIRSASGHPDAGAERFLRWALARRDGTNDLDRLPPDDRAAIRRCGAAIVAELGAGTGEHIDLAALRRIDVPVTLMHGTDSSREFTAAAHRLAKLVPAIALVQVPNSGHAIAVDAPDEVAAAVRRALAR